MVIFAIVLELDVTKNTVIQMIAAVFMPIRTLADNSKFQIMSIKFANKKYVNVKS